MKNQLWIGYFVLLCVFIIFAAILSTPFIKLSSVGKGQHTGYITAIEQEGYIFPNYRVYVKTDNSSSQEDVYCMHRDKAELAKEATTWSKSRELVEVSFKGVRGFGLGLCEGIEIISISKL